MKDKEAREQIHSLRRGIDEIVGVLNRFTNLNISIKDCPKCKHPVLAQQLADGNQYLALYVIGHNNAPTFQCLSCGSAFTCRDECVCKVIEDDRKPKG